ncbi:hypothetical protein [Bacillus thuringiensis]|nr:hypothetical protein [Bacillus thuringiensis]
MERVGKGEIEIGKWKGWKKGVTVIFGEEMDMGKRLASVVGVKEGMA